MTRCGERRVGDNLYARRYRRPHPAPRALAATLECATPSAARSRKPHLDALAIALLVLCRAFWGFQQILIKFAVAKIAPL